MAFANFCMMFCEKEDSYETDMKSEIWKKNATGRVNGLYFEMRWEKNQLQIEFETRTRPVALIKWTTNAINMHTSSVAICSNRWICALKNGWSKNSWKDIRCSGSCIRSRVIMSRHSVEMATDWAKTIFCLILIFCSNSSSDFELYGARPNIPSGRGDCRKRKTATHYYANTGVQ